MLLIGFMDFLGNLFKKNRANLPTFRACFLGQFLKNYPKSYPINDKNPSIRQHIQGNKKALKPLRLKALCVLQDTAEN